MHIFGYPARLQLAAENGHTIIVTDAFKARDLDYDGYASQPFLEVDLVKVHDALRRSMLRPSGIMAFTPQEEPISVAIRRLFPNGAWQAWVTKQGKVWIDAKGNVHEITKMDKEYVLNVIQFLYENHRADIRPERSNPLIQALRDRLLK